MENKFNYTYKAPNESERMEIESIRRQYSKATKEESKLDKLRRLDKTVKNAGTVLPLVIGIIGTLIFGLGLTMILEWNLILWGIVIMLIGSVPTALAYPLSLKLTKLYKEKYGDEILSLSEELLAEKEKQND